MSWGDAQGSGLGSWVGIDSFISGTKEKSRIEKMMMSSPPDNGNLSRHHQLNDGKKTP